MPVHVAFLRAINLGATRAVPMATVRAAAEAAGGTGVETHLNTGNVRLTSPLRSRAKVEAALEAALEAAAGFAVPTIVLSPAELREVVARADTIDAERGSDAGHHVSFLKAEAPADAVAALRAAAGPGESAVVAGRAVHLLLGAEYHRARLTNALVERHLGVATARRITVVREVVRRWC
ncbi:DUF1697 domain-containing protein [Nocardioides sp. TRM66260-LWL]|uniref:DUF1697 domain-containing protein n=1 Tax=Nocardioides sp. TRM66260-LWL TaxID=2874478 RepID=UPI001CC45832|nr:DUF1697 domain-containing protein [Nocardioides sp. TRM66260-LWL]MBZ5732935.1 DUF1697 domain-containing protein [Nocardioides sp. TRM66260-LWL]